jgi:sporulation protein YlmC with PRC-barrel domain
MGGLSLGSLIISRYADRIRNLRVHGPAKINGRHTLNNIIGLKVYSSGGDFIGKIKNVYIKGQRISGWIIELDEKIAKKSGKKHILLGQKHITSIGSIVIIDKASTEHLEK